MTVPASSAKLASTEDRELPKELVEIIASLKQLIKQAGVLANEMIDKLPDPSPASSPEKIAESLTQSGHLLGLAETNDELRKRVDTVECKFDQLCVEVGRLKEEAEKCRQQTEILAESLSKVLNELRSWRRLSQS